MQFQLVDQILECTPAQSIVCIKRLTLGEEYLADHFPSFPVLPGVLMLEAMVQTSAWLLRATSNYAHSVITLREAKGIKYGSFLEPGQTLRIKSEVVGTYGPSSPIVTFKCAGDRDGAAVVNGKITLVRYNLAEKNPAMASVDEDLIKRYMLEYLRLKK